MERGLSAWLPESQRSFVSYTGWSHVDFRPTAKHSLPPGMPTLFKNTGVRSVENR